MRAHGDEVDDGVRELPRCEEGDQAVVGAGGVLLALGDRENGLLPISERWR